MDLRNFLLNSAIADTEMYMVGIMTALYIILISKTAPL
jgi:hypothetical protein